MFRYFWGLLAFEFGAWNVRVSELVTLALLPKLFWCFSRHQQLMQLWPSPNQHGKTDALMRDQTCYHTSVRGQTTGREKSTARGNVEETSRKVSR